MKECSIQQSRWERVGLRSMVWVETRPTRTHGQQKEGAPRMKRRRTLALLRHRSLGAHGTAGRLRGLGDCLLRAHGTAGRLRGLGDCLLGPHGLHRGTHSLRHSVENREADVASFVCSGELEPKMATDRSVHVGKFFCLDPSGIQAKCSIQSCPSKTGWRSMVRVGTRPTRTHGQHYEEGAPRMERRRALALR